MKNDLICRQDAKDAVDMALDTIDHVPEWVYDILLNSLDKVPSAEPEPICINLNEPIKVKLTDWGKPIGDGRPLADSEIIPRLQDIKRQIGGSYAIERAIEVLEELQSASTDLSTFSDKLWKIAYERGKAEGRKKGKWINKKNIYGVAYCSECDYELHTNDTNFCPNCGADMRDSFTIPTEIIESVIGYDD